MVRLQLDGAEELLCRFVHAAGIKCLSYTVNDDASVRNLVDLGTDGIVTDALDRFAPA